MNKFSIAGTPRGPMPHRITPMLAKLIDAPFNGPRWYFETKWDGFRMVAEIRKGAVQLYSRNQLSFNKRFPAMTKAFEGFGHDAVFDGELVVFNKKGKSEFELIQNYQKTGMGNLVYCVFDILYLDGHDLRKLALSERKKILRAVLPTSDRIKYSAHIVGRGKEFFKKAAGLHWEGIMGKDSRSPYRTGKRSNEWVKIKTHMEQEAVIGGFTRPLGSRKYFGALVLGVYEKGKLEYIGHTGGGFDGAGLKELYGKLKKLVQKKSPFATPPETNTPVTWVKPRLVCQVKFEEWTTKGQMRQPIYLGMRFDKAPRQVHRE